MKPLPNYDQDLPKEKSWDNGVRELKLEYEDEIKQAQEEEI
jgi:hypothetical protein